MLTIDGLPLHPLVIHAVVVLLPLAAVGTLAMAVRPAWRRNLGVPTLLVALAGTAAVPVALVSGTQLQAALGGGSPLVAEHAARTPALLPVAVVFVVLLAATVLLGRSAPVPGGASGDGRGRLAAGIGVLAALSGIAVTGLVIWIGHAGSTAVWQGILP